MRERFPLLRRKGGRMLPLEGVGRERRVGCRMVKTRRVEEVERRGLALREEERRGEGLQKEHHLKQEHLK